MIPPRPTVRGMLWSPMDNTAEDQPSLASYATERGLYFRETSFALPQATQLLRHGFMREVSGLVRGNLPGGLNAAWLSHVAYVYEGANDLKRSHFTLVLIQAPESLGFAVRVLCHDRDLSKLDMTNPDSEREIIRADDKAVTLESHGFLERYALFADNDQDENSVWRLFAPTLIDWLTTSSPQDFSFELQDGALCCFVPGSLTEESEIDGLCMAAARVLREVTRIGEGGGGQATSANDRRSRVDVELAKHTFSDPPKSIKAAAKEFKNGLFIGDEAWKFGAEAYFREQANAAGFEHIGVSRFRASHIQTFLPGEPVNAAQGRSGSIFENCFLVFTNNNEYDTMGWTILVADGRSPTLDRGAIPSGVSAERGLTKMNMDGRSLIFSTLDGGVRDRDETELTSFLRDCRAVLA